MENGTLSVVGSDTNTARNLLGNSKTRYERSVSSSDLTGVVTTIGDAIAKRVLRCVLSPAFSLGAADHAFTFLTSRCQCHGLTVGHGLAGALFSFLKTLFLPLVTTLLINP